MAITKKKTEDTQDKAQELRFEVKVTRAKECENGNISFDMTVNGITIYGCFYKTFQRKDGSGEFAVIDFPQKKVGDKWLNIAWFQITKPVLEDIEKQLESLL